MDAQLSQPVVDQLLHNDLRPLLPLALLHNLHHLLAPTGALVVMMVYYIYISAQRQLFQIFTQSMDAIDVTSVTLSRINSINAIDVTRCKLMLIESKMFQCFNDPIFNSSTVQIFQLSNVPMCFSFHRVARFSCPLVHWSIGPLVH